MKEKERQVYPKEFKADASDSRWFRGQRKHAVAVDTADPWGKEA
jgi:hypothetical protein